MNSSRPSNAESGSDNDEKLQLVNVASHQPPSDQVNLNQDFDIQNLANDYRLPPLADSYQLAHLFEFKADHFLSKYIDLDIFKTKLQHLTIEDATNLIALVRLGSQNDSVIQIIKKLDNALYNDAINRSSNHETVGCLADMAVLGTAGSCLYTFAASIDEGENAQENLNNYVHILAKNCTEYLFYPECDTANHCQPTYNPLACAISYGMNKTAEYTLAVSELCNTTCASLIDSNNEAKSHGLTLLLIAAALGLVLGGAILFEGRLDRLFKRERTYDNDGNSLLVYKRGALPILTKTTKELLGDSVQELDRVLTELSLQNQGIFVHSNPGEVCVALQEAKTTLTKQFNDKIIETKHFRDYRFFKPLALALIKNAEKQEAKRDALENKAEDERSLLLGG
jgi:hypothetical protein